MLSMTCTTYCVQVTIQVSNFILWRPKSASAYENSVKKDPGEDKHFRRVGLGNSERMHGRVAFALARLLMGGSILLLAPTAARFVRALLAALELPVWFSANFEPSLREMLRVLSLDAGELCWPAVAVSSPILLAVLGACAWQALLRFLPLLLVPPLFFSPLGGVRPLEGAMFSTSSP